MTIDPEVTPTIGSYRLISRLAAGGMGEVWLAEHQLLGRRAAIKILLPQVSGVPDIVERFFAEAKAATKISDPGIVHVYDFGWRGSDAYIAMELLEGEVLSARLARVGRLPMAVALRLVHTVALTMAVAHASGIVHRDLKPENLFVIADAAVQGGERLKILDFGIAKLLGNDGDALTRTRSGVLIGTPTFMSPEQCRGSSDIDHRTDIYSLGCILYVLVAGRPPFVNSFSGDMIVSHLMEEPEPPSMHGGGSSELDALVLRCLAKDREERFPTMTALAAALSILIEPVGDGAPLLRRSGIVGREAPSIGELPTLAPSTSSSTLRTRGSAVWLMAALGCAVLVLAVIIGGLRASNEDASRDDAVAPPSDAGPIDSVDGNVQIPGSDLLDATTRAREDAAVDAAVDAAPRDAHVPHARLRDATLGSGANYLDP